MCKPYRMYLTKEFEFDLMEPVTFLTGQVIKFMGPPWCMRFVLDQNVTKWHITVVKS